MRQEKIAASGRLDMADIAAVWPASAMIAPIPIPEVEPASWESPVPRPSASPVTRRGEGQAVLVAFLALIAAFAVSTLAGIL